MYFDLNVFKAQVSSPDFILYPLLLQNAWNMHLLLMSIC